MKKLLLLLTSLLMLAMLAGCGGDDATTGGGDGGGTEELTGWAYIENKGELIVGLDDTFAPMGFRDEAGELVGFDIDLANAVGEELGITITFQPIDWNAKEMELSTRRIDCIWNGMSATPERQESMALTKKYLNNKIVIMTMNPDLEVNSAEDLLDLAIATQVDSAALETMQADPAWDTFAANVTEFPTYDECILAMQGDRCDVMVVDQVLGEYKNANMGGTMKVCAYDFGDDFYAIGCRQGETDLADKLNGAIQALIDDGTAAAISEKWFGTDIVILEDY